MPNKLKLGVVGTGNIFRMSHAPGWAAHPEVEFAAFCDTNPASAGEMAAKYQVSKQFTNYHELLADPDIDIIDICTPNRFHSEVAVAALQAGKHVFCEKPDAINPVEAQKMADAARESGKILMVMRNNRFRGGSQFLKTYVKDGYMVEIYTGRCGWIRRRGLAPVGWFTNKALSGGGPLIDLGVHYLDLGIWLMGNPRPVTVSGAAYNKFGEAHLNAYLNQRKEEERGSYVYDVEDLAMGFVRFDNGASMQFEFSWASNIEEEKMFLELRGTKGGIRFDNNDLKIFSEVEGVLCDISPRLAPEGSSHQKNINHFIDCVQRRAEPIIVPETGVDMITILTAIYESANTGFEVRVEPKAIHP